MDLKLKRGLLFLFGGLLVACAPLPRNPGADDLAHMRTLSGVMSGRTVLGGEVYMPGDALIPSGSSLRLRPGTIVYVQPAESTKIDPEYLSSATELLIRGTLWIDGTARHPVRFIPLSRSVAGEPAWAGITLVDSVGSRIDQARIEYAETAILAIGSSPEIRGNQLRNNRYGIIAQQGSFPLISNNVVEHGEAGIFCWLGSSPQLIDNRVADHVEEGIFIDASSRPLLQDNQVTGNDLGLVLYDRRLAGNLSGVSGNREDLRLLTPDREQSP